MSKVIQFPKAPKEQALYHFATSLVGCDDPRVAAVEHLRKGIEDCVRTMGRETTLNMLMEAIKISDTNNWRERARRHLDGDKS